MNKKTIILSKKEPRSIIKIRKENPFFKFLGVWVEGKKINYSQDWFNLKYTLIQGDDTAEVFVKADVFEISVKNTEIIAFEIINITNDKEVSIEYTLTDLIDVNNPLIEFNKHIDSTINTKIFFSAPFGQGKTFFLEYFFKEREDDFNVFNVFPVNYSVADNKDIFKYIKVDLLFQLLSKGVEFEDGISESLQIQSYFLNDPKKIIISLLKLFSAIGGEPYSTIFLKSLETLKKLIENNVEFIPDDKGTVEAYIKEIFEEEGSLFEDNLITQIIRQFLSQLKSDDSKKNVLVIEDLDRLDPEHIFRILNVISAHFDKQKHAEFESQNKFGFDKIILVGDINNIKSVFTHKFGKNASFNGYMSKFYSSEYFEFNNTEMISYFIEKLDDDKDLLTPLKSILLPLIYYNFISTRNLFKLKNLSLKSIKNRIKGFQGDDVSYSFRRGLYTPIIYLISNQIGAEEFKQFIEFVKNKKFSLSFDSYNELSRFLVGAIGQSDRVEKKMTYYDKNNGVNYFFEHKRKGINDFMDEYSYAEVLEAKIHGKLENTHRIFNLGDFYNLLIENVEYCSRLKI